MAQIFISYRRSDAAGHAGRLRDRLRAHFGDDVVFQDVDNIPDGEEFAKVIERALDSCKVALVVIGRNWVHAQSTQGVRRFEDPDDWVRTEVGILLRRGIRVVPVLVQGASLPRREDLPDELKDLAGRNARELRDSAWDADMSLLLRSLEPAVGSRRKRNLAVAGGIAAAVVAGLMYLGLNVDIRVGEVAVPDLEGKTVETAREVLAKDGLKNVHEQTVPSADFGKGRVVRTEPAAGRPVVPRDRVTVFVSTGAPAATPSIAPPAPPSSPPATSDAKVKRPVSQEASVAPKESRAAAIVPVEDRLAGYWAIRQQSPNGSVMNGVMRLVVYRVDGRFAKFGGEVDWSPGATPGVGNWESPEHRAKWERGAMAVIERTAVEGDAVRFVMRFASGLEGTYTATVDPTRTTMIDGKTVPNRGDSATWTAKRIP